MKSTGVVRRIDELGRIVLPKEMRKILKIKAGDNLEIFMNDGDIVLSKYNIFDDKKDLFQEYGVRIESMRGLDENELALLGCNVTTLTCNNVPTWAKSSVTSVVSEKNVILFSEDKLETMPNDGTALALIRPVITITKSNLEAAK